MTTRTDSPSPRRLRRARAAGDYPRSPLLKRGLVWVVALCMLPDTATSLWNYGERHVRRVLRQAPIPTNEIARRTTEELHHVVELCLPVLALIVAAHLAVHFAQSRGAVVTRMARRGLFERLAAMCSLRTATALGLQWVSFGFLICYGWLWFRSHAPVLAASIGDVARGRELSAATARQIAWGAGGMWCFWGCVDLILAHRSWLNRMRMSRGEKQQEQREHGTSPWVAQQRLERHRDASTGLALGTLETATLVTRDRFELVALLRYVPGKDMAPHVVGVYAGALARRCVGTAIELGIAVIEDAPLTRMLARCKPESSIPESAYARVAELIALLPQFARPESLDAELAPRLLRT